MRKGSEPGLPKPSACAFPETCSFLPWGQTFPSTLPSPLHASLFNQVRSLSHPGESESRSTAAQDRPVALHHLLLLSYSLSRPLPYSPAPSRGIAANTGPAENEGSVYHSTEDLKGERGTVQSHECGNRASHPITEQNSGLLVHTQ